MPIGSTGLNYSDFLRDIGRHFSINRMLAFDSVKLRLERQQELSFLEFNYMILQAYDFVELHRRYGCVLQMGGSDQWGNIVNGIDLGRRLHNAQLFALTSPLITTSSGAKMGKTAAGAVWLNRRLGEPLRILAILAQHRGRRCRAVPETVHSCCRSTRSRGSHRCAMQEINEAKKVLATEATALVHGRAAADEAAVTARTTFEEGGLGASLPTVEAAAGLASFFDPPALACSAAFVKAGSCQL